MSKKPSSSSLSLTITGILALGAGMTPSAQAIPDQPKEWEKCAGIAKAGQNDCGALDGSHSCAGQATTNNGEHEWVYVPKGTCAKITGGTVAKVVAAKEAGTKEVKSKN